MYQATNDKSYLNKFVEHSFNIMQRKGTADIWDAQMSDPDPDIMNPTIVLYTGPMLRPMAEYIYIVKNNTSLYNTDLTPGIVPHVIDSHTILGYGDYANWLQEKVITAQNRINNDYWINDEKCFSKYKISACERSCIDAGCIGASCIFCHCPDPIEINFNSSYAATMFFIGAIDPSHLDYRHKAEMIVSYFKARVTEYTPNQSYTWFHDNSPIREDVAHGVMDLQIPEVARQLYGNTYYTSGAMTNFSHTFTRNIWDPNVPQFHNNVFGMDTECSGDQVICGGTIPVNGTPNFYGPGEVLGWMSLQEFDDEPAPNDMYTVLTTQGSKLLEDDASAFLPTGYCAVTHVLSGGISVFGLSDVVKAQWSRECVNLTLYNRDLTYSQDFDVKNTLRIAPEQIDTQHILGQNSFAEPIVTYDKFIIEPSVISNMTAGESIELHPGFEAHLGATLTAFINPSSCTDGRMMSEQIQSQPNDPLKFSDGEITAYPNPNSGIFFIKGVAPNSKIQVFDLLGKQLPLTKEEYEGSKIDLTAFQNGVYFIKINIDGKIVCKKIIKQ
jgi:hypothetical protein